jgi:hypothetical protein
MRRPGKFAISSLMVLLWSILLPVCFGQEITATRMDSVIGAVKIQLMENFVNGQKAHLISDSLHIGQFSRIETREAFVKKLNEQLYLYSRDKHLSVQYVPEYARSLADKKEDRSAQDLKEKNENYGFEPVKRLADNIAYVKLRYFADTGNARNAALKMLLDIHNSSALILDLRGNSGGSGSMVQLLSSMFLQKVGDPILQISYKAGNQVALKTDNYDTKYKYPVKPLFILTDHQTFSAAEAFTFILKNRNRAKIIGATTAGAGNIAGPYPLGHGFIITIPVGQITDPITKTGWEATGVAPDVLSEDSLKTAIALAKQSIR